MLRDTKGVGYFADADTSWYKAQRAFNSFEKTALLEKYLRPPSFGEGRLLDLYCGKGQDIARAIEIGFGEVIAVGKDKDALCELLERKHKLRFRNKDASGSVKLHRVDFEDPSADTIAALKSLKPVSVDVALCSFAIHYICHSAAPGKSDSLVELAKLTAYYLKPSAKRLITAFVGETVFKLLKDRPEWVLMEDERVNYAVKRKFTSDSLVQKDQKIVVLLPFSGGNFYSEYLVNYNYLQQIFERYGFSLVHTEGFGSMLDSFKHDNKDMFNRMSAADKEYVTLYGYMVFQHDVNEWH